MMGTEQVDPVRKRHAVSCRNRKQRVPDPGFRPVALILDLAGPNQQTAGVQQHGVDSDDAGVISCNP